MADSAGRLKDGRGCEVSVATSLAILSLPLSTLLMQSLSTCVHRWTDTVCTNHTIPSGPLSVFQSSLGMCVRVSYHGEQGGGNEFAFGEYVKAREQIVESRLQCHADIRFEGGWLNTVTMMISVRPSQT